VIPDFQNIISVLLKLLLTSVTTTATANEKGKGEEEDNITLEYIEQVDAVRDCEVYSKAISGILMILLKWTKSSRKYSKQLDIITPLYNLTIIICRCSQI
jgi:hypothetical protein